MKECAPSYENLRRDRSERHIQMIEKTKSDMQKKTVYSVMNVSHPTAGCYIQTAKRRCMLSMRPLMIVSYPLQLPPTTACSSSTVCTTRVQWRTTRVWCERDRVRLLAKEAFRCIHRLLLIHHAICTHHAGLMCQRQPAPVAELQSK